MDYGIVVIENVFGTWKNLWKFFKHLDSRVDKTTKINELATSSITFVNNGINPNPSLIEQLLRTHSWDLVL